MGYPFLPGGKINTYLIAEHWDDILRFVATIKLKQTTTSQLFKRLNSYSTQHPLYKALKQFGRIIKSIFLLKYIDDPELRQMIQGQLNKMESSNQFSNAVFHADNQEFKQAAREDQLIAENCKRLIQNAIICWNYLYLSKVIHQTKNRAKRNQILETIRNGSVVVWRHINLQGEYDFSDKALKNSIEFQLPDLLNLKIK